MSSKVSFVITISIVMHIGFQSSVPLFSFQYINKIYQKSKSCPPIHVDNVHNKPSMLKLKSEGES